MVWHCLALGSAAGCARHFPVRLPTWLGPFVKSQRDPLMQDTRMLDNPQVES